MVNNYEVYDLMENQVKRKGFQKKEEAKENRDSLNQDYYGQETYREILEEKRTPRYIVRRSENHHMGESNTPKISPARAPKKSKNKKKNPEKILNG